MADQEKIAELADHFAGILEHLDDINDFTTLANNKWQAVQEEEMLNHVISPYAIDDEVEKGKSILRRYFSYKVFKEYEIVDVDISSGFFEREDVKNATDFHALAGIVYNQLVENADYLAYQQAIRKAEGLTAFRNSIDDIVHGDTLRLHAKWMYEHLDFDTMKELYYLEKLMEIVLDGRQPSTVDLRTERTQTISSMLESFRPINTEKMTQVGKFTYDTDHTESVRVFKNGRLDIKFKDSDEAWLIAEALING